MPNESIPELEIGVEPAPRRGLSGISSDLDHLEIRPAERSADAALLGAAIWSATLRD